MLKTPLPGPARRAIGGGLFAIASIVVAFAAWATEPATSPTAPQSADAAAAPHGRRTKPCCVRAFLRFPPDAQIQVSSAHRDAGAERRNDSGRRRVIHGDRAAGTARVTWSR